MSLPIVIGSIYALLSTMFVPLYVRIIYIFCTHEDYKLYRSYKLMAQIGLAQIATFPGQTFIGVAILLGYDWLGIGSVLLKVANSTRKAAALLGVVLAYERLIIICGFPEVPHLISVLTISAWLAAAVNLAVLFSPWTDFYVNPSVFGASFNSTLPWTAAFDKISYIFFMLEAGLTFCAYLVIIGYLLHQKITTKDLKLTVNEKSVFVQAFVRFLGDITSTSLFHIVLLSHHKSITLRIFTGFVYIINNVVFPPLMSVAVSRKLRRKVLWSASNQVENIALRNTT
ncbi:hypothetical protein QR680_007651 [Steinernema hermaphroditum]|uniref:7TM GPCR serpentine receptor class x (Srx) domain-containing protein n=1 Tax=Steinernema hermaphroditum TaxID=289476 RepID=A0AA39M6H2_9BILA|nr:hypothetical protein QR680_007651 [Steinernema hermaphroditum]